MFSCLKDSINNKSPYNNMEGVGKGTHKLCSYEDKEFISVQSFMYHTKDKHFTVKF